MNQTENNLPKLSQEELDWSALLYVAGELSADEIESFESRLAVDQAARDAVAQAVELSCLIAASESNATCVTDFATEKLKPAERSTAIQPLPVRQRNRRYVRAFAGVVAVASAIGLAVIAFIALFPEPAPVQTVERTESKSLSFKNEGLVHFWIETHIGWNDSDSAGDNEENEFDSEELAEDNWIQQELESEDVAAPNWMLVGLQGLSKKKLSHDLMPPSVLPQEGQIQ